MKRNEIFHEEAGAGYIGIKAISIISSYHQR